MATVWIKICVNCNFNDNRVICYIKSQLKYPKSLKAIVTRVLIWIKMFFLESPHWMGFLKGSQMLQQNCEQNQLYIFKIWWLIILIFPDTVNIFYKTSAKLALLYRLNFQSLRISCSACLRSMHYTKAYSMI